MVVKGPFTTALEGIGRRKGEAGALLSETGSLRGLVGAGFSNVSTGGAICPDSSLIGSSWLICVGSCCAAGSATIPVSLLLLRAMRS